MSEHQHRICTFFLQLFAFIDDNVFVGKEFVVREQMIFECVCRCWGEYGGQTDDSDLDSAGESVQIRYFLFGKELCLTSF